MTRSHRRLGFFLREITVVALTLRNTQLSYSQKAKNVNRFKNNNANNLCPVYTSHLFQVGPRNPRGKRFWKRAPYSNDLCIDNATLSHFELNVRRRSVSSDICKFSKHTVT